MPYIKGSNNTGHALAVTSPGFLSMLIPAGVFTLKMDADELRGVLNQLTMMETSGQIVYRVINEGDTDADYLGVEVTGVAGINSLIMLGAPGKIVQGNTVTIGSDVYEFRDSTPPAGGTAGRIWVYNGADSAASRDNFIKAVNGVVDAALITRPSAGNVMKVVARAGTTLGTVDVLTADAVGGNVAPSGSYITVAETLTTATDIWRQSYLYGGKREFTTKMARCTVKITAAMITAGFVEVEFPFAPAHVFVTNEQRAMSDTYVLSSKKLTLTLAGGASPACQPDDYIDILVFS